MPRLEVLVALLSLLGTIASATPVKPSPAPSDVIDIKAESRQLISEVRALASGAKQGMAVKSISEKAEAVLADASDIILLLPGQVSECETDLEIKMAAAGTGSHEVLTLLLADDGLAVLNGRLSLSLAFLERVAQQLEDELAVSSDVGPHLAAVVFGANATASIAETADEVITPIASIPNDNDDNSHTVARRQSVDLGGGFTLGTKDGLKWQSGNGRASVNVKPTFNSGLGVTGNLNVKSGDGRTRFHVKPSYNAGQGFGGSAGVSHTLPFGTLNIGGSYDKQKGGVGSVGLSIPFGK